MTVRRAKSSDSNGLLALLSASDSGAHVRADAADLESSLQASGTERIFVAEVSRRLVGFASMQLTRSFAYTRPTAELTDIFVLPDFRRRGIGSELLSAVIAEAESEDALELFARVSHTNSAASNLYSSLGFQQARHSEYRLRYY